MSQSDFNSGTTAALRAEPNGPVAQWILRELQDLACIWTRTEMPAAEDAAADAPLQCYYTSAEDGTATWSKPAVVAAMERFSAMRNAAEVSGQARQAGKQRASVFRQQQRTSHTSPRS